MSSSWFDDLQFQAQRAARFELELQKERTAKAALEAELESLSQALFEGECTVFILHGCSRTGLADSRPLGYHWAIPAACVRLPSPS